MTQFHVFVGIDVSKDYLDIALLSSEKRTSKSFRIANLRERIDDFISELKVNPDQVLFCLEHTGRYGSAFLEAASDQGLHVRVEHPLQLKRSLGMVRGKTDALDALRIAEYACRFADKAVPWKAEAAVLAQLRKLQSKRSLLVKAQKQLKQAVEGRTDTDFEAPMQAIKEAITAIEQKMVALIKSDQKPNSQYELLRSVPGVGAVSAVMLLVTTQGFTRLTAPKKLACYAGIAPFPYRSGSSIRRGDRVSKFGNKELKVLLNLAAWNAIRSVSALKNYFDRKVAEGKHKLSVINAVRNKLVAIILSVIRPNTPFVKKYNPQKA